MSGEDLRAIMRMKDFGGAFVFALGEAASKADPENLAKLKVAFPEIWDRYANWPEEPHP